VKLLKPLELQGCRTAALNMVPSKEYFKPVLIIDGPLTIEMAGILECSYLFDQHGNPHPFEGKHYPEGALPGAEVRLAGSQAEIQFTSQKVAHLAVYREEKTGMRLQVRIHLPEDDAKLHHMIDVLANLNKSTYTATIKDRQVSLFEGDTEDGFPVPDSAGQYARGRAISLPFKYRIGKHSAGLVGEIMVLEVRSGFIAGWNCVGHHLTACTDVNASGQSLSTELPAFSSEKAAIESAATALLEFAAKLEDQIAAAGGPANEAKAIAALKDWCFQKTRTPALQGLEPADDSSPESIQ
jgi:hypothetical protein